MTQKLLSFQQLLLYIDGEVMIVEQHVKWINREWAKFCRHNTIDDKAFEYMKVIGEVRKKFSEENIMKSAYRMALMLELRNENNKAVPENILSISDDILNNASIVGMADLRPEAYKTLDTMLYDMEFENFKEASKKLILSLEKLKNECGQLGL